MIHRTRQVESRDADDHGNRRERDDQAAFERVGSGVSGDETVSERMDAASSRGESAVLRPAPLRQS